MAAAPAAPHAAWQVRLLGGLELSSGAQQITRLPSRAVSALLARLALWPERTHAREELVELLWPGVELAVGRNRLRQALSTLKSQLEGPGRGAVLVADRLGVRVAPGALACDAREFEGHVRAGRHAAARACYRGELLPGFYDEWIDEERLRLAALFDRVDGAAAPVAVAAAVAANATEHAAPAARVTLPNYLTRMFGADEQGARLRERVLTQRLVTLIGPGGGGKTRLAVEVAHSLREAAGWPLPASVSFEPFDLIAFVPLLACTTRAQTLDAITRALQIEQGAGDPLQALAAALAGRRALLVLDNFEQLVGQAEDLVAALLAALPALHLLVTSRQTLGLDGEHEWPVQTLLLPAADADLDRAAANPAVALFVERARAVRADFHLGPRNAATVVALVRVLEGMPLAIELAASRVRSIAPADMLARLASPGTPQLDLLARSGPRGHVDTRHASMVRAIEWSWGQLTPPQARLLSALTTFDGGFSAAAAAALLGSEQPDAPLRLDELVAASLVHVRSDGNDRQDGSETWRFGLYPPIREFAASKLDAAAAAHWRQRQRAWALQWVQALPATPPLPELRAEMANLCAALGSAVHDQAPNDAIELLLRLRRCLEDVELPAAGLQHAQDAVARCEDPLLQARGHTLLGPLLFNAGQRDAALQHAERGLQCAQLDGAQRGRALHALARVRWRSRRRAGEVEPLLDEALALAAGDVELTAGVTALRAFVSNAHHRDRIAGERLHAQALALWQQLGNRHAINSGRYNLAVCAQHDRRNHVALQRVEPIIADARELQDWRRLSQALNVRGNAHGDLRQWAASVADYQACIRTAWASIAAFDLVHGLWNLPRPLAHLRQPERAARLMAFAARFWLTRFGEFDAGDRHELRLTKRLLACQLDTAALAAAWHDGEQLSLAQAVALALEE